MALPTPVPALPTIVGMNALGKRLAVYGAPGDGLGLGNRRERERRTVNRQQAIGASIGDIVALIPPGKHDRALWPDRDFGEPLLEAGVQRRDRLLDRGLTHCK